MQNRKPNDTTTANRKTPVGKVTPEMTRLSVSFEPGPRDVICGRGKKINTHPGNRRYKAILDSALARYSTATSKHERSTIVSEIVDAVRSDNPNRGGFVKEKGGVWYEVGNHLARERVGQNLRDSLCGIYKSSSAAKRRRREALSAGLIQDMESIIHGNTMICQKMEEIATYMEEKGQSRPDDLLVLNTFTLANTRILEAIKDDKRLLEKFSQAEANQKCSHHTLSCATNRA